MLMTSSGTIRALPPPMAPPLRPNNGPRHASQPQAIDKTDCRRRLALTRRRRRHRRDEHDAAVFIAGDAFGIDLQDARTACIKDVVIEAEVVGDGGDRAWKRSPLQALSRR